MSLFTKAIKAISATLFAATLSLSTAASAAPMPGAVIEGGQLVGLTNINVEGFGLYDVTFNGQYQGNVYSRAFVEAAGIAGFNLATGSGVFQGSLFDLVPELTRGCGPASTFCDWMVVFDEQPVPTAALTQLNNACAGLPGTCTVAPTGIPTSLVSGGIFRNYGGANDHMDTLSLVFGLPAIDSLGLTYLDWTPSQVSQVPVPAAAFLFAPALFGFLGLRRKMKS